MAQGYDTTSTTDRSVNRINRLCVGDIVSRVAWTFPDREAIVAAEDAAALHNDRLTYSELDDLSNRIANWVVEQKIGQGDKVLTYCHNTVEYQAVQLALAKTGAVTVAGNPMFPNDVIEHILEETEPDLAIVDSDVFNRDSETFDSAELAPDMYLPTGGDLDAGVPFYEATEGQPETEPEVDIQPTDIFQIMYTAGTTGPAKGVMHSHLNIYTASSAHHMRQLKSLPQLTDVVGSGFYPLSHIACQTQNLAGFIGKGCNVILRKPTPEKIARAVEEEGINFINVISPSILRQIAELDASGELERDLTSIQSIMWGWAPVPPSLRERYQELVGEDVVFGGMDGQTECVTDETFWVDENEEKYRENSPETNYFGTSAPLYATVPLNDEGNVMPAGDEGHYEKSMRSPATFAGYYERPEKTAEVLRDGWFRGGDAGYVDEDGLFVFTDRFKDIIKSGGESVASSRVESAVQEHPKVEKVAVVGLPHERWEEAVTAVIVPKDAEDPTEEEIIEYCESDSTALAPFEVPKGVVIDEEIPATVGDKKQKYQLRERHADYYQS